MKRQWLGIASVLLLLLCPLELSAQEFSFTIVVRDITNTPGKAGARKVSVNGVEFERKSSAQFVTKRETVKPRGDGIVEIAIEAEPPYESRVVLLQDGVLSKQGAANLWWTFYLAPGSIDYSYDYLGADKGYASSPPYDRGIAYYSMPFTKLITGDCPEQNITELRIAVSFKYATALYNACKHEGLASTECERSRVIFACLSRVYDVVPNRIYFNGLDKRLLEVPSSELAQLATKPN